MKQFIKKFGSKFIIIMVIFAVIYSFADKGMLSALSNEIEETFCHNCVETVQISNLNENSEKIVKECFKEFFTNPKWDYFYSTEGNIVEFTGKCNYMNKEVDCTIQYIVLPDKKNFKYHAMTFNKIPQNDFIYASLMKAIEKETLSCYNDTNLNEVTPSYDVDIND